MAPVGPSTALATICFGFYGVWNTHDWQGAVPEPEEEVPDVFLPVMSIPASKSASSLSTVPMPVFVVPQLTPPTREDASNNMSVSPLTITNRSVPVEEAAKEALVTYYVNGIQVPRGLETQWPLAFVDSLSTWMWQLLAVFDLLAGAAALRFGRRCALRSGQVAVDDADPSSCTESANDVLLQEILMEPTHSLVISLPSAPCKMTDQSLQERLIEPTHRLEIILATPSPVDAFPDLLCAATEDCCSEQVVSASLVQPTDADGGLQQDKFFDSRISTGRGLDEISGQDAGSLSSSGVVADGCVTERAMNTDVSCSGLPISVFAEACIGDTSLSSEASSGTDAQAAQNLILDPKWLCASPESKQCLPRIHALSSPCFSGIQVLLSGASPEPKQRPNSSTDVRARRAGSMKAAPANAAMSTDMASGKQKTMSRLRGAGFAVAEDSSLHKSVGAAAGNINAKPVRGGA